MARNMGSLDTSLLVRLFVFDLPKLSARTERLLSTPDAEFSVSDLAVYEMSFVLTAVYKFSRAQLADAVLTLMSIHNINCNRRMFGNAVETFTKHPKLSFADCCLAEYAALTEAVPLWTFDKKLATQSGVAREAE